MVSLLYLSPTDALQLQIRQLASHALNDLSRPVDVVRAEADADFADVPFSCPAARHVLPIPNERMVLVIGDEYSVLYSAIPAPPSPKRRLSVASGPSTSPRASAKRSPQNEMVGVQKRRKSSITKAENWELKPLWRVRQGFGTVLAATVLRSDPTGASILLGDDCGRLTAIGWEFSQGEILDATTHIQKINLGLVSPHHGMLMRYPRPHPSRRYLALISSSRPLPEILSLSTCPVARQIPLDGWPMQHGQNWRKTMAA